MKQDLNGDVPLAIIYPRQGLTILYFFLLERDRLRQNFFYLTLPICRTLSKIKFVARKRRVYKYAWLTFAGSHSETFAGRNLETSFMVLKITKLIASAKVKSFLSDTFFHPKMNQYDQERNQDFC